MNRGHEYRIGYLTVKLIEGDIAQVKADALITAINSAGLWFGGVDGVIQRVAGSMFHEQAQAVRPLVQGRAIVAKKRAPHLGQFGDVVFVVDDLKGPLRKVIVAALAAADAASYQTVSLPAIRTGVMLGAVEKDAAAAAREIVSGISAAAAFSHPGSLKELTLVVYNQRNIFDALAHDLEQVQS